MSHKKAFNITKPIHKKKQKQEIEPKAETRRQINKGADKKP